jgi:hypothetical protein
MSIWNNGVMKPDMVANSGRVLATADAVKLPDEFVGHLMVFRTFDKVSYALVMSGVRPIHAGDTLKHPDATQ